MRPTVTTNLLMLPTVSALSAFALRQPPSERCCEGVDTEWQSSAPTRFACRLASAEFNGPGQRLYFLGARVPHIGAVANGAERLRHLLNRAVPVLRRPRRLA